MRHILITVGFLCLGLAASPAQVPGPAEPEGTDSSRAAALVEELGSNDFQVRTRATEELRKLGEKARSALEEASRNENLERRTRAELLLRELDEAAIAAKDRGPEGQRKLDPLRPVEPGNPGVSPPSGRLFPGSPPRLQDFQDLTAYMEALDRFFEEQRESLTRGLGTGLPPMPGFVFPGPVLRFDGSGRTTVSTSIVKDGEAVELTRGPGDRVALKVETIDPATGERTDAKSYEAQDLESFKQQFPEIYARYEETGVFRDPSQTFGFQIFTDPFGPRGGATLRRNSRDRSPDAAPKIGIVVAPVPEALRAHLDLPEKALLIEKVVPGSLAERALVRPYDILTHVNEGAVGSVEDINRILNFPEKFDVLTLKVLRKGNQLVLAPPRPR